MSKNMDRTARPLAGQRKGAREADADKSYPEHGYEEFGIEERLAWSYFLKAYKAVVERVDKEVRDGSPLTLAEYELLLYVNNAGGRIRFIDLAKLSLLSQSRISRQIDALQAKGFLQREITDSDRRATFAALTPAGRAALDAAEDPFARAFHANFLDIISKRQLSAFSGVLRRLMQNPSYPATALDVLAQARASNAPGDEA